MLFNDGDGSAVAQYKWKTSLLIHNSSAELPFASAGVAFHKQAASIC